MQNRSVPCDTVLPHLVYTDVAAAIDYLVRTFGFREHYRYGDPPQGAQLLLGRAAIMIRTPRADSDTPKQLGKMTSSLTLIVDNVDPCFARAQAAGADLAEGVHVTAYGERQFAVIDPWGHHWLFSQHARDVPPEDWGAVVPQE